MTQAPKKPKPKEKLSDKEQSERFIKTAEDCVAGGQDFDKAIEKILIPSPRSQ